MSDMGFWDLFFSSYFMVMLLSCAVCVGWHLPFFIADAIIGIRDWFTKRRKKQSDHT